MEGRPSSTLRSCGHNVGRETGRSDALNSPVVGEETQKALLTLGRVKIMSSLLFQRGPRASRKTVSREEVNERGRISVVEVEFGAEVLFP